MMDLGEGLITYIVERVLEDRKTELETLWNRAVDLVANKNFRNKYFETTLESSKQVIYERKDS